MLVDLGFLNARIRGVICISAADSHQVCQKKKALFYMNLIFLLACCYSAVMILVFRKTLPLKSIRSCSSGNTHFEGMAKSQS